MKTDFDSEYIESHSNQCFRKSNYCSHHVLERIPYKIPYYLKGINLSCLLEAFYRVLIHTNPLYFPLMVLPSLSVRIFDVILSTKKF
jgi:hypothetical protein